MGKINHAFYSRLMCIILGIAMILTLAACGNTASSSQSQGSPSSEGDSVRDDTSSQAEDGADKQNNGKILIAYFTVAENSEVDAIASASVVTVNNDAKGRVRAVADMIQRETGGELFSIQTSVEYPGDGGDLIDFAADEQDENARPELTSHIENLEEYDTIFIGYPNWWYDMPMVMYSFFDEYDFSGKTIIPFNVHNGSQFSGTIETIHEMEPDATVITDGFTVSERVVADAAADVTAWLLELGY